MAASLVFRSVVCSCQRAMLKSNPKFTLKTLLRPISYSKMVNHTNTSDPPQRDANDTLPESTNQDHRLPDTESPEGALHKFAKVVEKVEANQNVNDETIDDVNERLDETFASMLRNSKLIAMGEAKDSRVLGQIVEVMEDDLYIDFGGKFHCVCPRPKRNANKYQRGTQVILNLNCFEMSSAFLGSDIHITLLEADAILLGLHTPKGKILKSSPQ